jgi:hypothetical protein
MSTTPMAAVALAIVFTAGAAQGASEADLGWIGKLPGVTLQTARTTRTDGYKAIYTLSAAADGTMESVRAGLVERGWTVEKAADVPAGAVAVRTVTADKDGARVKIALTEALGVGTLTVSLRGGDARASGASSSRSGGAAEDIVQGALEAAGVGGGLVLAGNAVTETHDCGGGDVSVTASRSMITLEGTCRTVKVVGNSNTVKVKAAVQAIHAVGRANTVIWSAARNSTAPAVKHVGTQNRVHSDTER